MGETRIFGAMRPSESSRHIQAIRFLPADIIADVLRAGRAGATIQS